MSKLFQKWKKTSRKGFTLTEILLVVGICACLAAASMVGITAVKKSLTQRDLDDKAQIIYEAVQSRLSELSAGGSETGTDDTYLYASLSDVVDRPSTDYVEEDVLMKYLSLQQTLSEDVSSASALSAELVPAGTFDATLYGNTWIVEIIPESSTVYAVYYAESSTGIDNLNDAIQNHTMSNLRHKGKVDGVEGRAGLQIGYYDGREKDDTTPAYKSNKNSETDYSLNSTLSVVNSDELIATLSYTVPTAKADVCSVTVTMTDGNKTVELYPNTNNYISWVASGDPTTATDGNVYQKYQCTLILDSLRDGYHFSRFGLNSGENVTLTLTVTPPEANANTVRVSEKTVTFNSLFANNGTEKTASIENLRHLQNLDTNTSGVVNTITSAVLTKDIDNAGTYTYNEGSQSYTFTPIINGNLTSFNGQGHAIKGLVLGTCSFASGESTVISSALFGNCSNNTTGRTFKIENLSLVNLINDYDKAKSANYSAALLGKYTGKGNLEISNCYVYLEGEGITKTAKDIYTSNASVTKPSNYKGMIQGGSFVGGLVGYVESKSSGTVTISNSSVSTVIAGTRYVGGLIGYIKRNVTITDSYADCYLYSKNSSKTTYSVGGLVGSTISAAGDTYNMATITNCYAAGFVYATKSQTYGLVAGNISGSNSYSVITKGDGVELEKLAVNTLEEGSHIYNAEAITKKVEDNEALSALGDAWTTASSGHPYNLDGGGRGVYSFPKLKSLEQYGDWDRILLGEITINFWNDDKTTSAGQGTVVYEMDSITLSNDYEAPTHDTKELVGWQDEDGVQVLSVDENGEISLYNDGSNTKYTKEMNGKTVWNNPDGADLYPIWKDLPTTTVHLKVPVTTESGWWIFKTTTTTWEEPYTATLVYSRGDSVITVSNYARPQDKSNSGLVFTGWYTGETDGVAVLTDDNTSLKFAADNVDSYISDSTWVYPGSASDAELTLYAQFSQPITITLQDKGINQTGKPIDYTAKVIKGQTSLYETPNITTKTRQFGSSTYILSGWYVPNTDVKVLNADCSFAVPAINKNDTWIDDDGRWQKDNGNIKLVAHWKLKTSGATKPEDPEPETVNITLMNGTTTLATTVTATVDTSYQSTAVSGYAAAVSGLTKQGYNLTGWFTAATGGTQVLDASGYTVENASGYVESYQWKYSSNITLYAQWAQKQTTIKLMSEDGKTQLGTVTVSYEDKAVTYTTKPSPTKASTKTASYEFNGWSCKPNAENGDYNVLDKDLGMIGGISYNSTVYTANDSSKGIYWAYAPTTVGSSTSYEISLYAQFNETADFDVTLYDCGTGNTYDNKVEKTYTATVRKNATSLSTYPAVSTRVHYQLDGWYIDNGTGTKILEANGDFAKREDAGNQNQFDAWISGGKWVKTGSSGAAGSDIYLVAHWTEDPKYTVSFDKNGGTGTMANQTIYRDTDQALTTNSFTYTGYDFDGWNTQADGKGTSYTDGQSVKNLAAEGKTITLYAQWKKIVPKYTLTLKSGDRTLWSGSVTNEDSALSGYDKSKITYVDNGITFTLEGWYTAANDEAQKVLDADGLVVDGEIDGYIKDGKFDLTWHKTLYAKWLYAYDRYELVTDSNAWKGSSDSDSEWGSLQEWEGNYIIAGSSYGPTEKYFWGSYKASSVSALTRNGSDLTVQSMTLHRDEDGVVYLEANNNSSIWKVERTTVTKSWVVNNSLFGGFLIYDPFATRTSETPYPNALIAYNETQADKDYTTTTKLLEQTVSVDQETLAITNLTREEERSDTPNKGVGGYINWFYDETANKLFYENSTVLVSGIGCSKGNYLYLNNNSIKPYNDFDLLSHANIYLFKQKVDTTFEGETFEKETLSEEEKVTCYTLSLNDGTNVQTFKFTDSTDGNLASLQSLEGSSYSENLTCSATSVATFDGWAYAKTDNESTTAGEVANLENGNISLSKLIDIVKAKNSPDANGDYSLDLYARFKRCPGVCYEVSSLTPGKQYIIVSDDNSYAIATTEWSSVVGYKGRNQTSVSYSTDSVLNKRYLQSPASDILWTAEQASGGYYLKTSEGQYLYTKYSTSTSWKKINSKWQQVTEYNYGTSNLLLGNASDAAISGIWNYTPGTAFKNTVGRSIKRDTWNYFCHGKSNGNGLTTFHAYEYDANTYYYFNN